ncbi:MAG TPA: Asp-tRNA(Asn)/Glu-tRNA(Gln) amidotransferase subunit GatC [Candidatus Paceibacterota bacterium]|jgi:aspartyl-tRNA(Asn)/glutamyl-tRNA(Gln) amidotransferase subunit C|nr:Asp-tRNA(Asn)/Glu-tRNA(Gln) amidotransferase subunit GatC [Candidatus Paceibacterota bacterium]
MIDVQKLADLARLSVPKEEQEQVAKDLEAIVGFVDQIKSRDVSSISAEPDRVNVFRDDVVAPLKSAYDLVEAAPSHQDGFVKVPKVIE